MRVIKILIKNIKTRINYLKFLYSYLLEKFCLRFKYLSLSFRVLKIGKYTLLSLNQFELNKYQLAYDFEDLVYKILNLIKKKKQSIFLLEKFIFLINFSSKRKFYIKFLEDFITKADFNFDKLPNLTPYIVNPFYLVGDYQTGDRFSLILRYKKDKFYKRNVGLYKERSHLTAIGHLCTFSYYLKAREINFLGEDNSSFLYSKDKISNKLFFELIKNRADKLKVNIKETNKKFDYFSQEDHEMDLWPLSYKKNYIYAQSVHGLIEEKWREAFKSDEFFKLPNKSFKEAEKILKDKNILKSKGWFIGIHLRTTKDKRQLRNADIKNIINICDEVEKENGSIIFTGTNNFKELDKRKSVTFLNDLDITKDENELLQLFVWSQASFFVGNLSGGTHPPSLFGTPVIWIDVHPTVHSRPASKKDTVIPKRIYDLKKQEFLNFNKANSAEHFRCQTESDFLAEIAGYKIFSSDIKIVNKVIKFYISKYVFKKQTNDKQFFAKDHFLPREKGAKYKF